MGRNSPSRLRYKEKVDIKCVKCGKLYQVSFDTWKRNGGENHKWYCRSCIMYNMSDESKQKRSEKIKQSYLSKSNEEKEAITRKRLNTISSQEYKEAMKIKKQDTWKNKSMDKLQSISEKASINSQKNWNDMDKSDKDKRISAMRDGFIKWHNSLSEKEKENRSNERLNNLNNWWNSLTIDQKQYISDQLQYNYTNWLNNLSEEELKERSNKRSEARNNWWNKLSDNEKGEYRSYQSNLARKRWENMTSKEKESYVKKSISASSGTNKFHQRFERQFSESHLSRDYHLSSEYPTTNNGVTHCWDYAILDEYNELWMLVDLDGAYFHADICDYDGIHSHEEYDEKRGLSIPEGVRSCIITEKNFGRCFDYMCKTLILDYGEYVEHIFNVCRSMPFPYPEYPEKELIHAYDRLVKMDCDDKYHQNISLNTRVGDRIIQHFHHSIWHDHRGGELSPYEAWQDDNLLLRIIQNRIIYQPYLNPNKILQGFNIAKKAAKVSVFSAGRAKMIVCKYLSEFDTVFDPFSGYSGRMLGTISSGKRYIGQDISLIHTNESKNIIEFLKDHGIKFDASISQADMMQSHGKYECLFTCSPYSDKEQWEDVPVDTRSCDDWIDVCLNNFKCKRYVFVVDETTKYKDNIADVITNKSHFGSNSEYVIIIEGGNIGI